MPCVPLDEAILMRTQNVPYAKENRKDIPIVLPGLAL